jgi:hypothetical protein
LPSLNRPTSVSHFFRDSSFDPFSKSLDSTLVHSGTSHTHLLFLKETFRSSYLIVCCSIVRNDTAPRPLSKGILDGDLLYSTFELLPRPVQEMITKQIGTSVDEVLDDLEELRAVW